MDIISEKVKIKTKPRKAEAKRHQVPDNGRPDNGLFLDDGYVVNVESTKGE